MAALLKENQHKSIAFGSTFWPLNQLETIFQKHELFPIFSKVCKHGMEYKLKEELTEDERIVALEAQLLLRKHIAIAQQSIK